MHHNRYGQSIPFSTVVLMIKLMVQFSSYLKVFVCILPEKKIYEMFQITREIFLYLLQIIKKIILIIGTNVVEINIIVDNFVRYYEMKGNIVDQILQLH